MDVSWTESRAPCPPPPSVPWWGASVNRSGEDGKCSSEVLIMSFTGFRRGPRCVQLNQSKRSGLFISYLFNHQLQQK